jgi:spore maturation protein CgeB
VKIIVVSPIFGGGLPIAASTHRALCRLGHDAILMDLSTFQTRYRALLPSNQNKDQGGELLYREVETVLLEAVERHEPQLFLSLALAPLTERFLTTLRGRGVVTASWFVEDCNRFTMWKWQANWFDHFFLIQDEPLISEVKRAGGRAVHYLPCAGEASLAVQPPLTDEERHHYGSDISFMGSPYPNRVQLFSTLGEFSIGLWGRGWSKYAAQLPGMVREGERLISLDEEAKIYAASHLIINQHSSTDNDTGASKQFLNPRTFTAALCGVFQFIDERTLLPRSFEPGKEVATFANPEELKRKLHYFLAHPVERATMADAARERALREHTYEARLDQAMGIMGLEQRLGKLKALLKS